MRTYTSKGPLIEALEPLWSQGKQVGFVPTMGALHTGHKALVEISVKENDVTVVTVFVNPAQFNDPEDFERYPRDSRADIHFLEQILNEADIVYLPETRSIYPDDTLINYDLDGLDLTMEGEFRPGHFSGVANVVCRFFEIVKPARAYFGEKDFQQYVIIRHLAKIMGSSIDIIPVSTVREPDGLALSSRNVLLNPEERETASKIFRVLQKATLLMDGKSISELKEWVNNTLDRDPLIRVEYFEIVDTTTLKPASNWGQKVNMVGCIAAWVGGVRLIDNIRFYS